MSRSEFEHFKRNLKCDILTYWGIDCKQFLRYNKDNLKIRQLNCIFFVIRLYPFSKDKILYVNNFAIQTVLVAVLKCIYNSSFSHIHFHIYLSIFLIYTLILLHLNMPISLTQPPTTQVSHLQWLLVVLIVSSLTTISG